MIVLDASAALELLLGTPTGTKVADRIFDPGETLHAPELIDLEVAQVLRRYERTGAISPDRAQQVLDDFDALPLERYPHRPLLPRIWQLRPDLTAYDASYITLAELLEAPLLTCDEALEKAPHAAQVEVT